MGKIICEICGTSYPETNMQCPICGSVRRMDGSVVADKETENGTYTYVRGGRFSKKNVKKRNAERNQLQKDLLDDKKSGNRNAKRIVFIILIALFLAVLAIGAYAVIYIFGDTLFPDLWATEEITQTSELNQTEDLRCTDINIIPETIVLEFEGQEIRLQVTCTPENTTDIIHYASDAPEVATVDSTGKITAISEGEAKITVECGSVQTTCSVVCDFPDETTEIPVTEIKLNRSDFTLFYAGDNWLLYNGEVPAAEITWTSGNEEIVIVEYGRVVAVGEGSTRVYAEYDGKRYSCDVHVRFTDSNLK